LTGEESSQGSRALQALIVSDVRLYRDGLALGLAGRDEMVVLGTEAAPDFTQWATEQRQPDILFIDIGMPSALQIVRSVRDSFPDIKVIAFAVAECDSDVIACAEAGVAAYVSRDATIEDVIAVVQGAARGEVRCSPQTTASLFERLASRSSRPDMSAVDEADTLTRREREIVRLIDEGLSNKEIGGRLYIRTATVKNHVHHILEKLQVRGRAEAAAQLRRARGARLRNPRVGPSPMHPKI
jgi:two-component system, NarL family, nitrate/nitrite response regulator NarL